MAQSKRWCFTINNPGAFRPAYMPAVVDYMVFQLERGENGTEHLQGYLRLKKRSRMAAVKIALGIEAVHLSVAKGNEEQNKLYCTKEDSRIDGPWEHGIYDPLAGKQGSRSDIIAAANSMQQGMSLPQLALTYSDLFIRYPSGMERTRQLLTPAPPLQRQIYCHCLWGPTNTGKTHRVLTTFPLTYTVHPGRGPWDQYQGEEVILFDEFDCSRWPIDLMKQLLDKWRCRLDCRYTDKYAAWTTVFIISNNPPSQWWMLPPTSPDKAALLRRLHKITEVVSQEQEIALTPGPQTPMILDPTAPLTPMRPPSPGAAASSAAPAAIQAPAAATAAVRRTICASSVGNVPPSQPVPLRPSTPLVISSDSSDQEQEEEEHPRPLKRTRARWQLDSTPPSS